MRSWRAAIVFVSLMAGCGSRSSLAVFDLRVDDEGGTTSDGDHGGRPTHGGVANRGGATGAMAGKAAGGAAGNARGGSGLAGEPARGGEPSVGGASSAGAGDAEAGSGGETTTPRRAVEVAAGAFHTCARFDDGSVRCWGTGGYIGYGNTTNIGDDETPASVGDVVIGGRVTQLSASWYHTCALLENGKLRCFGDGGAGALGYGNTQKIGDNETPASAGDVDVGGKVRQVSAGPYHTCALLESGKVRCWGKNDHHQLGYSSLANIGDDESPASAGFVDVGGQVVQIAAGYAHSCALLDTGRVRCWGDSIGGSLGYGNLETIGDDEAIWSAGDVDLGGNVVQIATGLLHTCALLDTGNVRCWGAATRGQLGYGNYQNIGDDESPASAGDVDVGGKVKQITAGSNGTCALLENGKVRCWGSAELGELGYGNDQDIGDDETPATAGDVDVGGNVTNLSLGFLHACATLEGGRVRCWGRGGTAALGYGNVADIGDDEAPASAGDVQTH